ncbi:MAG: HAD-IIIA family hydrolase [Candidatus Omnitrophica bacterium]|nr:HAD-IIIA family hydrolase [Candidatus Omnitrophota bacterium]
MERDILERAKRIRLLLLDVDGVLTDGRIIYDSSGRDLKFFDVHDGLGVYLLKKAGIPTVLVTARGSKTIKPRGRDMQVEAIFENVSPKSSILDKLLKRFKVKLEEICYVGDDLVDLGMMKRVGFAIAVFNACPEVKARAHYITLKEGGRGAVREVAELILKAQGRWESLVDEYQY